VTCRTLLQQFWLQEFCCLLTLQFLSHTKITCLACLLLTLVACRNLDNIGRLSLDPIIIQEIQEDVEAAQRALHFKQKAYRRLQRAFAAHLASMLNTDEIFEVFRSWVGQSCSCTVCESKRAAAVAVSNAAAAGIGVQPGHAALLPSDVLRNAGFL
jgi:hypothetical protein